MTDTYGDSYEDQIISLGPIELSHGPDDGSEWDLSLDDSRMDLRTVALVCGIIATTFLIGLAGMSYIRGQGDCQDEPDGQDWTRDRSKPECSRAS